MKSQQHGQNICFNVRIISIIVPVSTMKTVSQLHVSENLQTVEQVPSNLSSAIDFSDESTLFFLPQNVPVKYKYTESLSPKL